MVNVTDEAVPVHVPSLYVPTSVVIAFEPSPEAKVNAISVRLPSEVVMVK
jgi:hypothetical protein